VVTVFKDFIATLTGEVKKLFMNTIVIAIGVGILSTVFLLSDIPESVPDLVPYAKSAAMAGWLTAVVLITLAVTWAKCGELGAMLRYALSCIPRVAARLGFPNLIRIRGAGSGGNRLSRSLGPGLPSLSLLPAAPAEVAQDQRTGAGYARRVLAAFRRCGLAQPKDGRKEGMVQVVSYQAGPAATRVTVSLPDGFRLSQLKNASEDLCAALGAPTLQVVGGRRAGTANLIIGNHKRLPVYLRPSLEHSDFEKHLERAVLPFLVGVDDVGEPIFSDLVRVRHLLAGGATGSGKSWWLNQLLVTLLLTKSPSELRLVLIDPKKVEMAAYHNTVHTLSVATEVDDAVEILKNLVVEMDRRYKVFKDAGCRNIQQYHKRHDVSTMPYVVTVIDELADLMILAKKEVEPIIQRLAQLARAAGIHLVVASQRPSVDVVTGVIKANLPSRVVFRLLSQADYSTILNENPNTSLEGGGDGLALIEGQHGLIRFQGAGVGGDEDDLERVISKLNDFWRNNSKFAPAKVSLLENAAAVHADTVSVLAQTPLAQPSGSPQARPDSKGERTKMPTVSEEPGKQVFVLSPAASSGQAANVATIPMDGEGRSDLVNVPDLPEPDFDEFEEDDTLLQLKQLIAQTGETRADKLRDMLGVRKARLHELMQRLVAEGWLEPPPPNNPRASYRLVVSMEESRRQ